MMTMGLTRRSLLAAGAPATAAVMLAACGAASGGSAPGEKALQVSKPVTITAWLPYRRASVVMSVGSESAAVFRLTLSAPASTAAAASSSVTSVPSIFRSKFSSSTLIEKGKLDTRPTPRFSRASSR